VAKTAKAFQLDESSYTAIQQICKSVLKNARASRMDYEDLCHNTVILILEKQKSFKAESAWKTWVFTIARNLWVSKKRHEDVEKRHAERVKQQADEET